MGFTCQRGGICGLTLTQPLETGNVVDDAGGGVAQQLCGGRTFGIGDEGVGLRLGQVGAEVLQRIAHGFAFLSHDRRAGHHAKHVEGHL